jgi:hypothetical protein
MMVVKTQRDRRDQTGLHIGVANVRRHFRKGAQVIDLMLDHLQIQCTLSPEFWQGRPEIHDPRLSEWLEFKVGRGQAGRAPTQLTMVRSGIDTFVVKPMPETKQTATGKETFWVDEVESAHFSSHSFPVMEPQFVA